MKTLGQIAYERWREVNSGKFAVLLAEWSAVPKVHQDYWEEVAKAVVEAAKERL